jgi:hypothetical protein
MRKLCTDEVVRVQNEEKLKKKTGFAIQKKCIVFKHYSYLAAPLALHFKDDL